MKRIALLALMILAGGTFAMAQIGAAPATDVLGAHLNYGRGCAGCHAPHSGSRGNGYSPTTTLANDAGSYALWGEDASPLYGVTLNFGDNGKYVETLPVGISGGQPDVSGIMLCLSCHDGNLAKGAMMTGKIYEASLLNSGYGANSANIPTLLGNDGTAAGNYNNDHPVGAQATIGCGGTYNWDCTVTSAGKIQPGPKMSQFITNYGFFVSPGVINSKPVVLCTTCHNQHSMNVVAVKQTSETVASISGGTNDEFSTGTQTGLPTGNYTTMFFIRAPYNPVSTNPQSNQTAQFCRQCHGGESNEMNNGASGTIW
jgi:hypothetical protein